MGRGRRGIRYHGADQDGYAGKTLAALDARAVGLPALAPIPLTLLRSEAESAASVARLKDILVETIEEQLGT